MFLTLKLNNFCVYQWFNHYWQQQSDSSERFEWADSFQHCSLGKIIRLVSSSIHKASASLFRYTRIHILSLFKIVNFLNLGELATWADQKQRFHHLIIWQKWRPCEFSFYVLEKVYCSWKVITQFISIYFSMAGSWETAILMEPYLITSVKCRVWKLC